MNDNESIKEQLTSIGRRFQDCLTLGGLPLTLHLVVYASEEHFGEWESRQEGLSLIAAGRCDLRPLKSHPGLASGKTYKVFAGGSCDASERFLSFAKVAGSLARKMSGTGLSVDESLHMTPSAIYWLATCHALCRDERMTWDSAETHMSKKTDHWVQMDWSPQWAAGMCRLNDQPHWAEYRSAFWAWGLPDAWAASCQAVDVLLSEPARPTKVYPDPDNYARDKWIWENILKKKRRELIVDLKKREKSHGWNLIENVKSFRDAALKYSEHHELPTRNFQTETPYTGSDSE
ncbi:MAG: hypothetical protein F9B45_09820 [Phycisphaera sp. RhM]|nr:hypothetical protein [Phycisphaera sp. RhM]